MAKLSDVERWVLSSAIDDYLDPAPGMPGPSEREVAAALALYERLGLTDVKYPTEWAEN